VFIQKLSLSPNNKAEQKEKTQTQRHNKQTRQENPDDET
jgi:hypothetical protein